MSNLTKSECQSFEREWIMSQPHYSLRELAEIFPEAKQAMKDSREEIIRSLIGIQQKQENSVELYTRYSQAWPVARATIELLEEERIKQETILKRLERNIAFLENNKEIKEIDICAVKDRHNLVEVVQQYGIILKKRGKNYVGLCPFHNEKTASFNVNEKLFHCFGCDKAGDVITFVQEIEKVDFRKALDILK